MDPATSSGAMKALSVPGPANVLASVRELEFRRVHASGQVYLDYTGAALYPEALLKAHFQVLRGRVFGNPHSTHPAAVSSTEAANAARVALLHFLDADAAEYDVVWTANASEAIRLVGESFPFEPRVPFVLTADNHNAVNGIRSLARARGATV